MKRLYLIGGASGTGKTTRARSLASELGAAWLQADSIWKAAHAVLPEGSAEREYLEVDDAIRKGEKSPEDLVCQHAAGSAVVCRALQPAIEFELLSAADTLVVDGAWLLPAWIASLRFERIEPETHAVLIHERDEAETKGAMRERWSRVAGPLPETLPRQRLGARVSWLYGNWLRDQALAHSIPVLDARPRESLRRRLLESLGIESTGR